MFLTPLAVMTLIDERTENRDEHHLFCSHNAIETNPGIRITNPALDAWLFWLAETT